MQLCALRIGSTINFSDLAANCDISVITAKSWLALLETSFILFQLPSYHENLGKRVTKSPKLYFYDVGLAANIIGIDQETLTRRRDLHGALFENMAIIDIIKNFNARGHHYTLTFYRDSNKNEIDLIIEFAGKTIPIEIKSSQTMNSKFFQTLAWFVEQTKTDQSPIVIYEGEQAQQRSQGMVLPWNELEKIGAE